jgi:hypothetical protein
MVTAKLYNTSAAVQQLTVVLNIPWHHKDAQQQNTANTHACCRCHGSAGSCWLSRLLSAHQSVPVQRSDWIIGID